MSGTAAVAPSSPLGISQYVLKVHSRCDLACDHCYMYRHVDQTWRDRPPVMTPETVRATATRIAEHALAHRLSRVCAVLHGGEPLLLGADRLRPILAQLRDTIGSVADLELSMQTNGVRLTAEICDLLVEYGVRVGISLDGDAVANDRHRRFADGTSSHDLVLGALELLRRPEYSQIYGGILCTIDVTNDPIAVYDALLAQRPPRVDLLLPHATWDSPPLTVAGRETPYADWLGAVYDRWQSSGSPMSIRLFDSLQSLAMGGLSATEALGLEPVDLVVVETDGAWEQADSLKTAYHGAAATDFNVFSHSVDEVTQHAGIQSRQSGVEDLCHTCQTCPVVKRCGGGLYAHRYRSGNGFDNPSVYCADLMALILTTEQKSATAPKSQKIVGAVPQAVFDELATGYGSMDVLAYLAESQESITRALVAEVGALVLATEQDPLSWVARAGWEALEWLDTAAPEAVARVINHPFVRSWAVRCLREPAGHHRAHLASLAAAAAIHAGAALKLATPTREGWIVLPTLGRAALPSGAAGELGEVRTFAGGFTIQSGPEVIAEIGAPGAVGDHWQPSWRADIGGFPLVLEDTDPYRDCYRTPVAERLTNSAAQSWYTMMQEAFASIGRDVPGQVAGLRSALRSVVPLCSDATGNQRSSAARNAFGAVAVTPVASADQLAVLLVHEIQHLKLGALLDLCDLVDAANPVLLSVPWRADPRPAEATLQGTYAHLSIADVWRSRSTIQPGTTPTLETFHLFEQWTRQGIDTLRRSGALTSPGLEFVERMEWTVRSWNGDKH